jgi:hypothetical protein
MQRKAAAEGIKERRGVLFYKVTVKVWWSGGGPRGVSDGDACGYMYWIERLPTFSNAGTVPSRPVFSFLSFFLFFSCFSF